MEEEKGNDEEVSSSSSGQVIKDFTLVTREDAEGAENNRSYEIATEANFVVITEEHFSPNIELCEEP